MNTGRFATPGKTRICPHCKATILDSATVCPGCNHHLRFDSASAGQRAQPALTPLLVEGKLRPPASAGTLEYSVVLTIRNGRGQEVARQVVGVGALPPDEERAFTLAVEVFKPAEVREPKPQATAAPRPPEARAPGTPIAPPRSGPTVPAPAAAPPRPITPPRAATAPATPSRTPAPPANAAPGAARHPVPSPAPPVNGGGIAQQPRNPGLRDPRLSTIEPKPQPKRS